MDALRQAFSELLFPGVIGDWAQKQQQLRL
jgi:hypothetical protein